MNNKELHGELSKRLDLPKKQVELLMSSFVAEVLSQFDEHDQVTFLNIGTLERRKKDQRILVHPSTKQRMLVPPKFVLSLKPSTAFKQVLKSIKTK